MNSNNYILNISNKACEILDGLENRQVASKMLSIMRNPHRDDAEEFADNRYKKLDVGEYRIVYIIKDETVQILAAGKRNYADIYHKLQNFSGH